jgi:hypothetical protein
MEKVKVVTIYVHPILAKGQTDPAKVHTGRFYLSASLSNGKTASVQLTQGMPVEKALEGIGEWVRNIALAG